MEQASRGVEEGAVLRTVPMLAVPDVGAAVAFYVERLGFALAGVMGAPGELADYGIVERDGCAVHFVRSTARLEADGALRGDVGMSKGGVYVEVGDVDAVAAELMVRGAAERIVPETKEYGMRDFWVPDLNGYLVAFGQRI